MKTLIAAGLISICAWGAIGDHAPSIPTLQSHPRLPHPDNSYLNSCWAARPTAYGGTNGAHRFWDSADAWNSAAPGNLQSWQYLLIAYMAEAQNSGPRAAGYLTKIKAMAGMPAGTSWDPAVNGNWASGNGLPLAYDWLYTDPAMDSTTKATLVTSINSLMAGYESGYAGNKYSPYNDQHYIHQDFGQMLNLIAALAVGTDNASSIPHVRWELDHFLNELLPTWKQVFGNGGACTSNGDSNNGGAWHESWEYVNQTEGLRAWYLSTILAYATATGQMTPVGGIPKYFSDNCWVKNIAYWMPYTIRPDWSMEPFGETNRNYFLNEPDGGGGFIGFINGVAEIYNDSTLRKWARMVNNANAVPDGFEPTAWPFYTPDSSGHTAAADLTALSIFKDFPGVGRMVFRSNWTEDSAYMTFTYGDSMWSHPAADTGAFTLFCRGPLAIRSGTYRPGSNSVHAQLYAFQAIAQNVVTVTDTSDVYTETYSTVHSDGTATNMVMPNDGGMRRVGSTLGNVITVGRQSSPFDPQMWSRDYEYYRQGKKLAYVVGSGNKYVYAAVDTTGAYNNFYSRVSHISNNQPYQANTSNRTFRVRRAVRQVLYIPRGNSAWVVVYDQVTSTNSGFKKKFILHSVNAPSVVGTAFTITRSELVTSKPFPGFWPQKWASYLTHDVGSTQYQFDGKLWGWTTYPASPTITTIGGANHEFDIEDPLNPGTFTNYNECGKYGGTVQCSNGTSGYDEGFGPTEGFVASDNTAGPGNVGGYRLEISPPSSNLDDQFIHVFLASNSSDTGASTAPVTTLSGGIFTVTWKDNADACTYTVTFPQAYGLKSTISATGTCIGGTI